MSKARFTKTLLATAVAVPALTLGSLAIADTTFNFGGYIKLDMMLTEASEGEPSKAALDLARDFYIPSLTPVDDNNPATKGEDAKFDAHARQSRFNFKTVTDLANGEKVTTFVELDFIATGGNGDERISNSYNPRIRHAFFKYGNWLFGQTWSTFMNVGALPETLDFIGNTDGTVFVRQPMIRYTNGGFQIAIENSESTVTDGGRVETDDAGMPDLVLRYDTKGDWGNIALAAVIRQLAYDTSSAGGSIDDDTVEAGLSLTGKFMVGEKDDIRWGINHGVLGRYVGLNATNDAIVDPVTGDLEEIDLTGYFISYRHNWNDQWRSTISYSALDIDNDTDLTGTGVTENTQSYRVNLLYSPAPKLTFGVEYAFAERELEDGRDGDLDKLQFSAKYAF